MAESLIKSVEVSATSVVSCGRAAWFKLLLFIVSLVHFIYMANWVRRWYLQYGNHPVDWAPDSFMNDPLKLLFASVLLLVGRWWSNLIAVLVSAHMIFQFSYGALNGISNSQDKPMFSYFVIELWLRTKYEFQPQELLQLGLALVIFSCAVFAVFDASRNWRRGSKLSHP